MKAIAAALLVTGLAASLPAAATDITTTFQAKIVIVDACTALSANDLDFGTQGVLGSAVDQSSTFSVTCTSGASYSIKLSAGANPSTAGDVNTRRMKHGTSDYVGYNLYSDSPGGTVWDNTTGVSRTGTGSAETVTVYGRVPAQATPPAGSYTDTVTVTVTY